MTFHGDTRHLVADAAAGSAPHRRSPIEQAPSNNRVAAVTGMTKGFGAGGLRCSGERPAGTWWGGAQAARGPTVGADNQLSGAGCLEGHHAFGA